jgi:hypothetical protein
MEFLERELRRLLALEENRKKDFYSSRNELQEIWDKLVSLRSHINRFESEIENAKIEDIMNSSVHTSQSSRFNGGSNYYSQQAVDHDDSLTVSSAWREADINVLKDKVRVKVTYKGKIAILEEKVIAGRRQISEWTNILFQGGSGAQIDITTSMNTRKNLLQLSNDVVNMEKELAHTKAALKQMDLELVSALQHAKSNRSSDMSSAYYAHNEAAHDDSMIATHLTRIDLGAPLQHQRTAAGTDVVNMSLSWGAGAQTQTQTQIDGTMKDLITQGPPLSADLADALRGGLDHCLSLVRRRHPRRGADSAAGGAEVNLNMLSECEFSLHEVLTGHAAVVRMNGEAPKMYLLRLERRLGSLLTLELQLQLEFQSKMKALLHNRDMVRRVYFVFIYSSVFYYLNLIYS